jgi:hypothetical protein
MEFCRPTVHPKVVSDALGHANIAITLDTYSHVTRAMHRQAAEALDAVLQGWSRCSQNCCQRGENLTLKG